MKPFEYVKRLGPRVIDTRLIIGLCLAVGFGVFFVVWNSHTLRLEVDGHIFAWLPIVAFGIVWSAGRDVAWRTSAGVLFGAALSVAALWGGMSFLPAALPLAWGMWLGLTIAVATAACHVVPRIVSFGAMAVGFGAGIGAGLLAGFDPATSAVSFFNVLMTVVLALVIGTLAAQGLHALVVAFDGIHITHVTPRSMRYRPAQPASRRVTRAS